MNQINKTMTVLFLLVSLFFISCTKNKTPLSPDIIYPPLEPSKAKLVFSRSGEIFTMKLDGSELTQLTHIGDTVFVNPLGYPAISLGTDMPQWNPDGKKIVFTESIAVDEQHITLIDLENHSRKILRGPYYIALAPAWSPDGKKIVYAKGLGKPHPFKIFLIDENGENEKQLTNTNNAKTDGTPDFSPNGNQITFSSSEDNSFLQIFTMNIDGTDIRQLTFLEKGASRPRWLSVMPSITFLSKDSLNHVTLYSLSLLNGSIKKLIQNDKIDIFDYSLSNDGYWIIFSARSEKIYNDIYLIRPDGSELRQITDDNYVYWGVDLFIEN